VSQTEEKIAAIVVTYNRKDLLGRCLDSLLLQSRPLNALYIIDNHSADGTYDFLLARGLIAPLAHDGDSPSETAGTVPIAGRAGRSLEVHYVRMPANTGGAGGFHEGMRRAMEAGFEWLWLMDDDLLTAPDALAVLTRQADALRNRGEQSFLLNSLVLVRAPADNAPDAMPPARETDALAFPLQELHANYDPKSGTFHPKRGVYHWRFSEIRDQVKDGLYRWACPFNGTFVPARVVAEIGLPNKDFFIWGDERDFLWRAARRFSPYTAVDSHVFHPPCREVEFDWRHYYGIRNAILVNRHFNLAALRNLRLILLSLARGIRHGRGGLTLVLRAIRDGLTGRLGKREDYQP
jgi:rhamnopyranosyl-N-acetylglucosaminyl-diphospho-decaprenol beta-1,3/1,4-galactofuranosyltransferase